ncbi:MAG: winged helix-turn-helix domain-containing protein [Dehalococcoidia bacterium]
MGDWAPYQAIVERAHAATRVSYVILWWVEPGANVVRPVCLAGSQTRVFVRAMRAARLVFPNFELPAMRYRTDANALTRSVYEEAQVAEATLSEVVEGQLDPLLIELGGIAGFRQMRLYPIVIEGRVLASLILSVRGRFTDAQRLLGADFARQVTLTWENSLLAQRLAEREQQEGAEGVRHVYGGLIVDVDAGTARRGATPLPLTRLEFDLLAFLVAHPERAIDREELARAVWEYQAVTSNFVDVTVMNLRRKLEADGAPRMIHAVRGRGYMLRPGI